MSLSSRHVRGVLFGDYVKMARSRKDLPWVDELEPADLLQLGQKVDPAGWYPMDTFERLGLAILKLVAHGQMEGVRMWGRFQVATVQKEFPMLLSAGEPRETMMRFGVLCDSFFDYGALAVAQVADDYAQVVLGYGMSPLAEETASIQSMGFFEGLLQAAGATDVGARFAERAWAGADRTLLDLHWSTER